MTFSGMVKEELSGHIDKARHCQLAELSSLLCSLGILTAENHLVFRGENEIVIRKYFTLLQKTFNIYTMKSLRGTEDAHMESVLEIRDEDLTERILAGSRCTVDRSDGSLICTDSLITQRNCCKRAFIRGAFLASGSISDPHKSYHMEFVCSKEERAAFLQGAIRSFEIDAKKIRRKTSYVVYVKESEQIADMLAVMGASVALMNLENIRIVKDVRNTVNRRVNCETANLQKTTTASCRQIDDILLIRDTIGLDSLKEGLSEIAELRLLYRDASLKELGEMLSPPVGKSGVNHRLRKIGEIAQGLRKEF